MPHLLAVDLQNDFASEGGACYQYRPCVEFIHNRMIPYLQDKNIKVAEIISDYRLPLIKAIKEKCVPGTWGYESIIPENMKKDSIRVKSLQSPCRIREHGGEKDEVAGAPYHDPAAFDQRLNQAGMGSSHDKKIILFGLTLDCCVLCVAQELYWRKYDVYILEEATDTDIGSKQDKEIRLEKNLLYWAKRITWEEIIHMVK